MRNRAAKTWGAVLALVVYVSPLGAQDQPLSVIDWLARNPHQPPMTSAELPKQFEPPVSPTALPPEVTVQPLKTEAPRRIGLVPSMVTGLPETLWSGSDTLVIAEQLHSLSLPKLPAAQSLLYTVLLTEALGPQNHREGQDLLTLERAGMLIRVGALDPALALLEQAGVKRDAAHFGLYMDAALLTGQEDAACAQLSAHSHLAPALSLRIFCAARQGDWPTAALLFDTGRMLGELSPAEARALERFLHPDSFEDLPPLPRPEEMTPLLFRLHEAIGEPFPTGALPRAYAVADLRDLAGWKTQLEAAERLAATGAVPANRLLGLYTARKPAASGGVWNRVAAIQQFETALRTRSAEAISKTLPAAWQAMQQVGLEMIFADLFADALTRYHLADPAGEIAQNMALLSPGYRRAARGNTIPPHLAALALGEPETISSDDTYLSAIVAGFDKAQARGDLMEMARHGRMGEAILRTVELLDDGAAGDPVALTQALATLRAFGMEDTVRRAALQILLLESYSG